MPPKKKTPAQMPPESAVAGTAEAAGKVPNRRGRPPKMAADGCAPGPAEPKVPKPRSRPPKPKGVPVVDDEETGPSSPEYLPPKPRGRPQQPKVAPAAVNDEETTGASASLEQTPPQPRPRGRPVKKVVSEASDGEESPEQPVPKLRGPPPKKTAAAAADVGHVDEVGASEFPELPAPKRRGRPPKTVVSEVKDDGERLYDVEAVPEAGYHETTVHEEAAAAAADEGVEAVLPGKGGRVGDKAYGRDEDFPSLENTISIKGPIDEDEEPPQDADDLRTVCPDREKPMQEADHKERLWCVECCWAARPGCLTLNHDCVPPDAVLGSYHRLAALVGEMTKFLQALPPDALRLRLSIETDDGSVSGNIECTLTVAELSSGNRQTLCTSLFAGKELMPERTHLALPLDNFRLAKVADLQVHLPERLPGTVLRAGAILLLGEHDFQRQGAGDADRNEDDATDYSSDRDPPGVRLYYGAVLPHQGVGASVLGYVTGNLKLLTKSHLRAGYHPVEDKTTVIDKVLVVREVKFT